MPSAPCGEACAAPGRDGLDGLAVRREVALRIALGARAFAEHVVAETQVGLDLRWPDASPIASPIVRPSTNWRPSNWIARTVAATTVFAPSRFSSPAGLSPSGRKLLDRAIALAERLASMRCGPSASLASKSARPSWSAVSAIAVSASGTRSSASASRIRARPSALEIGYSCSSDSIAQNGAGWARTPSTHGRATPITAGQSRPPSRASDALTPAASGRYGNGRRAHAGGASKGVV